MNITLLTYFEFLGLLSYVTSADPPAGVPIGGCSCAEVMDEGKEDDATAGEFPDETSRELLLLLGSKEATWATVFLSLTPAKLVPLIPPRAPESPWKPPLGGGLCFLAACSFA